MIPNSRNGLSSKSKPMMMSMQGRKKYEKLKPIKKKLRKEYY